MRAENRFARFLIPLSPIWSSPMAAILPILAFVVVVLALNFFEFGRGD